MVIELTAKIGLLFHFWVAAPFRVRRLKPAATFSGP